MDEHFRAVNVAQLDIHGMMRHVLDSLGALKVRLLEDRTVTEAEIKLFGSAVHSVVDHLTGFQTIDPQSALPLLLETFPDPTKRRDGRGWLPCHWAAAIHDTPVEAVQELLQARPLATSKGHLPINLREESKGSEGEATTDYNGLLPLHFVCSLKYPVLETVKCIMKGNPDAVAMADQRGWLPLHWAAFNGRNTDVIRLLIKAYPDGCFTATKKGKLPFQLAGFNRFTEMMDILFEANPDALNSVDYNGNTVMHEAAKSLNYDGVKKLLLMKPSIALERNFKEDLPIHRLFSYIPSDSLRLHYRQLETLKCLLYYNPESAALTDIHDTLPLMMAVYFNSSYEVIELLYNVYPSAALIPDPQGKLPVHYANDRLDVRKLLMRASPPLARAGLTDTFSRFTIGN